MSESRGFVVHLTIYAGLATWKYVYWLRILDVLQRGVGEDEHPVKAG